MRKRSSVFALFCTLFLFVFVLFMIWYIPAANSLRASAAEVRQDLETSRGRENKQQSEYDKAVSDLPEVLAQLDEMKPLAAQAEETVNVLKDRRKELRTEKKELEQLFADTNDTREDATDE